MKIHKSVTIDRVMALVQDAMTSLENPGVCMACGESADGCEPDARKYECDMCGERQVYGAEECLLMIA